ncbi:EpsG family protein [Empedobacter sp.]|uniref:EpsG family protein n=1 Tax=Empedobacter sp. TaxID=1927715 RepID=UPI0028A7476D|nr:EpsG family protein [Empedobacter sp.]
MIYFLLPILSLFAAIIKLLNIKETKSAYKFLMALIFMFYFIIVALRGEGIGTDYYAYGGLFSSPDNIEPGFALLIKLTKLISNDYRFFIIVVFSITLFLRYKLFKKLSGEISISMLMLFGFWMLVYDMNGIRQGLSLSFIGFAGYYAYKRDFWKFFAFTIVATSIHYSSIMFFPFYFIFNLKLNKQHMIFIILILYFMAIVNISGYLFSFVLESSAKGIFLDKVSTYSNMSEFNSNTIFSFNTFHRLLIFFVVVFTIDKIPINQDLRKFLLYAAFMNVAIFLLLSRFELIAVRGSLPYRYFELIFFSYLPFAFKDRNQRIWTVLILFVYIIFQIYTTTNVSSEDNTLIPYRTIFG